MLGHVVELYRRVVREVVGLAPNRVGSGPVAIDARSSSLLPISRRKDRIQPALDPLDELPSGEAVCQLPRLGCRNLQPFPQVGQREELSPVCREASDDLIGFGSRSYAT